MHRRVSLYVISFAVVALFTGCNGGSGGGTLPNALPGASSPTRQSAQLKAASFAPQGGLDCNGHSPIQNTIKPVLICADPTFGHKRAYDNGYYIGHDEPSIGFYSSAQGSGNNMQWQFRLNSDPNYAAGGTLTVQTTPTFWFSLAICDPNSYPQNPCRPDSDRNVGGNSAKSAGSAFLELQFYPPGWSPFITSPSCDQTKWCAALNIDSQECTSGFSFCNFHCVEPINFAFIQTNGVPAGPPGPGSQTAATFTPNGETLFMNQNDLIRVTIHDTPAGLLNKVEDLTTGQSGFMVASAANGFENTNVQTCATSQFSFHPEFSTAKPSNIVPWLALQANVNLAVEIGHFELQDSDGIDNFACFPFQNTTACQGEDVDFNGNSYLADWPDGTTNTATPLQFISASGSGIGPVRAAGHSGTYGPGYSTIQLETDVAASESTCNVANGVGCTAPPQGAAFYPFYSLSFPGSSCTLNFGNDIAGQTVTDFGQDTQYGTPNVAWFGGTLTGGLRANPCTPQ